MAITEKTSLRVQHIDIAKGICITLVALFHSDLKKFIPEIIGPMSLFRMPLFFFLSGVFFSIATPYRTLIWKKADALLKPYFVSLAAAIVVFSFSSNAKPLLQQLVGILYGNGDTIPINSLWFLTHLFAIYCFCYAVFKLTHIQSKSMTSQLITLTTMIVVGTYYVGFFGHTQVTISGNDISLPGLPYSLDIILISSAFFMAGAFCKNAIVNFKPNYYYLSIAVFIFLSIAIFSEARMDLNKRIYRIPLLTTIGAISGIYFIMSLAFYIDRLSLQSTLKTVFLILGKASLFILIFHAFIGSRLYLLLTKIKAEDLHVLFAIIAFIMSLLIPVLLRYIIAKSSILSLFYFPLSQNKLLKK